MPYRHSRPHPQPSGRVSVSTGQPPSCSPRNRQRGYLSYASWLSLQHMPLSARTGHNRSDTLSAPPGEPGGLKAANSIDWFTGWGDNRLGRKDGFGQSTTPDPSACQRKHAWLTDNAWSSPTRFAVAMASRNAVFMDSRVRSA